MLRRLMKIVKNPGSPSNEGEKTKPVRAVVATVIEPSIEQLIGALVLRQSLHSSPTPVEFRLCIVQRNAGISPLIEACKELGLSAVPSSPRYNNPFLNKWLIFDAFTDLRDEPHLLLADWDTVLCAPCPLPGPYGSGIAARRNPKGMYRDLIGRALKPLPSTSTVYRGWVWTSINGGILAGVGKVLFKCAEKTASWVDTLEKCLPDAPHWKIEQLALSIAVGELGLVPLDKCWNVTPQFNSKVADKDVCLWHYNDGVEASYMLKRSLACPERVAKPLGQLAKRWPRSVDLFHGLYQDAIGSAPVHGLLAQIRQASACSKRQ